MGTSRSARGLDRCPICDYDFATLPSAYRCPECGFEYDEHTRVWMRKPIFFLTMRGQVLFCAMGVLIGTEMVLRNPWPSFVSALGLAGTLVYVVSFMARNFRRWGSSLVVVGPSGFFCRAGIHYLSVQKDWANLAETDLTGLDAPWTNPVLTLRASNLIGVMKQLKLSQADRSDIRRALEEGLKRYHATESTDRAREEVVEQANQSE